MTAEEAQVDKRGWLTKRVLIITSWASVSTALLLMVLIGGAIYLNDMQSRCGSDEGDEIRQRTEADIGGTADVVQDNDKQTDLYIRKNKEGAIVLLIATDFKKKLSATYLAEFQDKCFLAAGEDLDWADYWNADESHQPENDTDNGIDMVTRYKLSDRVTDMSILPAVIRPFCVGKHVHWMEHEPEGDSKSVDKREDEPMCSNQGLATLKAWRCIKTNGAGNRWGWIHYCFWKNFFIRHCHVYELCDQPLVKCGADSTKTGYNAKIRDNLDG